MRSIEIFVGFFFDLTPSEYSQNVASMATQLTHTPKNPFTTLTLDHAFNGFKLQKCPLQLQKRFDRSLQLPRRWRPQRRIRLHGRSLPADRSQGFAPTLEPSRRSSFYPLAQSLAAQQKIYRETAAILVPKRQTHSRHPSPAHRHRRQKNTPRSSPTQNSLPAARAQENTNQALSRRKANGSPHAQMSSQKISAALLQKHSPGDGRRRPPRSSHARTRQQVDLETRTRRRRRPARKTSRASPSRKASRKSTLVRQKSRLVSGRYFRFLNINLNFLNFCISVFSILCIQIL